MWKSTAMSVWVAHVSSTVVKLGDTPSDDRGWTMSSVPSHP